MTEGSLWNVEKVFWKEYRNTVRAHGDAMRKAKAHFELKLLGEVKDNKEDFCKYNNSKGKTRESE